MPPKSAQSRRPPTSTPSVGRVSAPASTNITSLPWRTLSQLAAAEGTTKHQERVRQYRASQKEKEEGGEVVLNSASSPVHGAALPHDNRQHVNSPDQTKHSRLASMRGSNDQLVQRREAEVSRRRLRSAHQRRLIDLAFNDMSDKAVADNLRISSRLGARSRKGFEAMFDTSLFDDEDEADEFFMQIAAVSASVKKPPLKGRMITNHGGPRRSSSGSGRCDSVIPSRPSTAKGWDPQLLQKNQDASRPTTADSADLREGRDEGDTDMDVYSDTDDMDNIPVARDEHLHALYYGSVAGPAGEGSGGGERSLPTSAMDAVPSSSPIRPPAGRHKSHTVPTNLQSRPATAAKPKPKSAHNSRPATATTAIFDKSSPSVCVALASFRPNWARAITDLEAKGRHRIVAAEVTAFSTVMYHYALEMDGMLALATTVAKWTKSILEAEYAHRDKLLEDQRDIRTQLVKEERSTRRRLARFIEKKKARKGDASEASVENRREEAVSGLEALLLKTSLQRNNMSTRSGSSSAASNSVSRPSTAEGGGVNLRRFRPTSSTSATRSNQLSRRPSTVSTLHPRAEGRIGREEGVRPSTSKSTKIKSTATSRPATAQSAESNFTAKAIREKNRPKTNAVTEKDIRQRDERWLREAGRFTDGLKRELLQQKDDEPSRPPTQGAGVFGARALAASHDGSQNEGHMEAGPPKHSHSKTRNGGLAGAKLLAEARYEQKLADALTEEEWEKKRWLARHSHIAPITRHRQMQSMGRKDLKKGLPIASTQNVKNTDYFMLEASPDHSLANAESEMQATTLQPDGLGARFDRSMFLPFSGASEFEHQQLRANSRGGNSESSYSKYLGNSVPLVSMMGASTSLNNAAGGDTAAIRRQPSRRKRMSAVTASKYSDRLRRAEALGPSDGAESGEGALMDSKQPQAQPAAMSAKALAIERSVGFISSYRAPSAAVAMSGSVNAESSASAANFDDKAVTRRRSVAHAGTITVHSVAGSTLDLNGASPLRFNTNNTMIFNATGGTTSPSSAAIADSHRASVSSLTRVVDRSNRISVVTVDSSAGESSVNPAEGGALGGASPNSGSISNATNNTSGGSRQGRVTVMPDEPHQAHSSGGTKSANNSISVPRRKSRIEIIEDPDMSAKDADMAGQRKAIGPPSLLGAKDHPTSFYYKVNAAPKAVKSTGGSNASARAAASERSEIANQVKYFSVVEPDNNEVDEAGEAASSSHINSNTYNNNKPSLRVSAEEWALDASDFM